MPIPVVTLPNQFHGHALGGLANDVVLHAQNGWPPEIHFDLSSLSFIRPAGVVFLSNLFQWLFVKGTQSRLINCNGHSAALRFLDDSLFFEQHCGAKLNPSAAPRNTTQPLQRIHHQGSHDWLANRLVPWLAARLEITPESLYAIKTCVGELFNNIKDHTQYDIGSIFIQHFPNENKVMISLSDFGLGIPSKVRQTVPHLSDSEAIQKAVEEGFTSKSHAGNKGVGLDYLLNTVVLTNGGKVTIYSGSGIVRFKRQAGRILAFVRQDVGFCPGTTIDIEVLTNAIEVLPSEREELQWS